MARLSGFVGGIGSSLHCFCLPPVLIVDVVVPDLPSLAISRDVVFSASHFSLTRIASEQELGDVLTV